MISDPWQARDLRKDEKWLQAQEHAQERGDDNPIFTGSLGTYEGVVIHENEQCVRETSTVKIGHALFLGAQAGVLAAGSEPTWEEDTFDYNNQQGFSIGRILGVAKTQFMFDGTTLSDFGVVNVITSSVDD